ncbi:DUF4430 domain-containing protein [Desulfosporosinus sp. BG]|uniref:DUF4430 domain-containing protein n=1 Tax=Desulfosporosinus sp. BG TaxID=1633135 RepID=UPI00083AAF6F|nr:DUF4430 domain-containing protein [Desulfosporosinus sp. BG]ODA43086.1 hypothetical protein DSBG_0082 [Desulfosporosinus sp. BG]
MKKLASLLAMFLLVVALLLTGCGVDNQTASGLPKDSVNKVSSNMEATKSNNTSLGPENKNNSADSSKSQVDQPIKADLPKTIDSAQSQENPSKTTAALTTTIKANPSTPTPTIQVPIPIQPENTDKPAVTIAINCSTAVAKGLDKQEKFKDVVPANGIILPPTKVEFKEGETVFDVLKIVVRENNIQMQYEGSNGTAYIKGINNLYELDGGPLSGWMYCVNKLYANFGCNQTKLKNGDTIEWNYTCNMGRDLGQK